MAKKKNKLFQLLVVSPAGLWMLLFVVAPLIIVLVYSFINMDNRELVWTFTLDNYKNVFSSLYASYFMESFITAGSNTIICILIGYPFATILAKANDKTRGVLTLLLMVPFYTNLLVRLNGWKMFLDNTGWINEILQGLGLTQRPVQFMYTRGAVMFGMVYSMLPFMILPLMSSIRNLDHSLIEASYDLGMTKVKTFFHVTVPLTMPGIFAGTIMVFIPSMGYFYISDIMGGAKHQLLGNLIQTQFSGFAYNWPFGAAITILFMIATLILVGLYKKSGGNMNELT